MENEQDSQNTQDLTKKKVKQLKREERMTERLQQASSKRNKKYWMRFFLILLIFVAGFGLWKLSQQAAGPSADTAELLKLNSTDWVKGKNDDAAPTLIEYLDFQCPACASYYPLVKQLYDEYGDRIRFAVRHFPLVQIHGNAMASSRAAEASGKQGKFWEMHDILFEKQNEWSNVRNPEQLFTSYAESINLNREHFLNDYKDDSLEEKIKKDRDSGSNLGVPGTPTFFFNGQKIENPRNYSVLKSIIENAIAK